MHNYSKCYLPVFQSYGGYREIANYTAAGKSEGASGLKTTAFIDRADTDEKPDMSRSMRRKAKPFDTVSKPTSKGHVIGRYVIIWDMCFCSSDHSVA